MEEQQRRLRELIVNLEEKEREIIVYRRLKPLYIARVKASDRRLQNLHDELRIRDLGDNLMDLSTGEKVVELNARLRASRVQQIDLQDACIISLSPPINGALDGYRSSARSLEELLRSQISGLESDARAFDYS
jgi:hypothetical protein